jgi:hypothetical protein
MHNLYYYDHLDYTRIQYNNISLNAIMPIASALCEFLKIIIF